jgi:hypothetical protein
MILTYSSSLCSISSEREIECSCSCSLEEIFSCSEGGDAEESLGRELLLGMMRMENMKWDQLEDE